MEVDPALAQKRWDERFTIQKGSIKIVSFKYDSSSYELRKLRALSIRQPWAWLVVNGYKDIENRSWRTSHRGPLLIHASQNRSLLPPQNLAALEKKYHVRLPRDFDLGGIIGVVEVVGCVKTHPSKWKFRGSWGWVLKNARRLPFRKCKGAVGFFRLK
jgi:hypothetical protein